MTTAIGILIALAGLWFFMVGSNGLRKADEHRDFGVSTEGRQKMFSWIFLAAAALCFIAAAWLVF